MNADKTITETELRKLSDAGHVVYVMPRLRKARVDGFKMYRIVKSAPTIGANTALDTSLGSPWHRRVLELEAEGLCTSDAQGVADVEFQKLADRRRAAKSRREAWL